MRNLLNLINIYIREHYLLYSCSMEEMSQGFFLNFLMYSIYYFCMTYFY